ncbi:MAG: hypothetical protein KatS3mg111_2415 [Pirellulaceae bacterium]|nr:MAG: hypothetical protein KatS3mg111_2415 [Pirellulaceae bacterium]
MGLFQQFDTADMLLPIDSPGPGVGRGGDHPCNLKYQRSKEGTWNDLSAGDDGSLSDLDRIAGRNSPQVPMSKMGGIVLPRWDVDWVSNSIAEVSLDFILTINKVQYRQIHLDMLYPLDMPSPLIVLQLRLPQSQGVQ